MLHSGLLLLEANLNYPVGSSFNTITKDLIGNTWNIISGITVAFVLYILTYAYISANGAIISETISMNLGYHANPRIVGICTAIFVASVLWISSLAASRITSLFLGLKIISFVIVFGSFFFQVDYSILRDSTSTTAGTSYFRISLWLCGVSGVIWFPRQYSQPDYLLWKTQRQTNQKRGFRFAAGAGDLSLLALLHDGEYPARKL